MRVKRLDGQIRQKIIEAAIPVFAEHGLRGGANRFVAAGAGVNSAMIYYYFKDKESLFHEAVRKVLRDFVDSLVAQRREFTSAEERISFLIHGIFDYYGAKPERMRLLATVITSYTEIVGNIIEQFAQEGVMVPLDILKEGQERGQIKPVHPVQAWWAILGACLFTLQMRHVWQHRKTLPVPLPDEAESRQEIIAMFCHGLPELGGKRAAVGIGRVASDGVETKPMVQPTAQDWVD